MGQIPALVLPDGTLMTETAAMIIQLCERHPEAKLAPPVGSPESAQFQRWLFFMATNIYSSVIRFYYSDRFTTNPAGVEGVKEAALSDLDRHFAFLNDVLESGPYLLGQIPQLLEANPRIRQLVELVQARPAVAWVWAEHEEQDE
jgi:glutathione S-transferase